MCQAPHLVYSYVKKFILGLCFSTEEKKIFIRVYGKKKYFDFHVNIKFVFPYSLEDLLTKIKRNVQRIHKSKRKSSKKFSGWKKIISTSHKKKFLGKKFANEINLNM